jgi:hypothetical protein
LRTRGFSLRSDFREIQESSRLGRSLVGRIVPSLLWAVVLVAVAELISRPSALPDAPGWLLRYQQPLEPDEFEPFALTAAQVGGTLLALYFATVGVVASTAYANAPHRIRLLFVRERSGRFYTRSVALLVAAALIVVGLARVDVTVHALTFLELIVLAVFTVLSLVELGVTIFNFFDPASLASTLVADFVLWVNAASAGRGRLWEDPSFQAHYQRQAASILETFDELLELIVSTHRPDYRRVAALAGSAALMQQYYSGRKSRIPTKSHWYPRRYQHPSWLTAADSRRSIALATSTTMQPNEAPDHFWVEDALAGVITRALRKLLNDGEARQAVGVCSALLSPMRAMGGGLQVEEAVQIWRQLVDEVWTVVLPETPAVIDPLERAVLADMSVSLLINVGLGLQDRAETITETAFAETVDRGLRRPAGIYRVNLPVKVLQALERMEQGIRFERDVEGHQVSSEWFPRQLAARAAAGVIREDVDLIVREIQARVAQRAREAADRKEHVVAAALVYRGLELCNKTEHQAAEYKRTIAQLTELRKVKDEFWPPDPPADWLSEVSLQERWLVALLANLTPSLAVLSRGDDEPDWFGHAYAILVDWLFRALQNGDEELFAYLFTAFFDAMFAARERVAAEVSKQDWRIMVAYVSEPLADLLEISGYALLFSELDGKNFWDTCCAKWDAYLEASPEHSVLVRQLAVTLDARDNLLLGIKPRDIERTGRRQQFDHLLRSRGITDERWSDPFGRRPAPAAHASPIVRVFAPADLGGFEEPEDLFAVEYLSKRPEWQSKLTRRAESLAERLQWEQERVVG